MSDSSRAYHKLLQAIRSGELGAEGKGNMLLSDAYEYRNDHESLGVDLQFYYQLEGFLGQLARVSAMIHQDAIGCMREVRKRRKTRQ